MPRGALYKADACRHSSGMEVVTFPAGPFEPSAADSVIPAALLYCPDYAAPALGRITAQALEAAQMRVSPGARVLVKPNLVTAQALACSDPRVTAAACAWLLDHGARVEVADSPGFGSAEAVARAVGLAQELKTLGLAVRSLNRPVAVRLDTGACFKISRQALDCDLILSVPKVKAHGQMLVTLAVKNLFGCVSGLRKALIHAREGRAAGLFRGLSGGSLGGLAACGRAGGRRLRHARHRPQPGQTLCAAADRRQRLGRGFGPGSLRRTGSSF